MIKTIIKSACLRRKLPSIPFSTVVAGFMSVLVSACGGGDSNGSSDPFLASCETNGTELHGCWKSSCLLMDGGSMYGLYIVNFKSNELYRTYLRLYQNSTCDGTPFSTANLVNNHAYRTGNQVTTTNGTTATEINFIVGTTGYSIYDVTVGNELCFPDADYNWTSAGGGLAATIFSEPSRADTIDYTNCMTRFI